MSRKNTRDRRLKFFDLGNNRCPICLVEFSRDAVKSGNGVSIEHVPPKSVGGVERCLTCSSCNDSAGRTIDQAAAMRNRAIMDAESGRGVKLEVDAFGTKRTTYLSPVGITKDYLNAKLARSHLVDKLFTNLESHGQEAVILAEFTKGDDFDLTKGIIISSENPSKKHIEVSWLRSAYLLVFCLLGKYGYRYAESESIMPIREQIMNPDKKIVNRAIRTKFPATLPNEILFINKRQIPYCWVVKIGDSCVLLPRGGSHIAYEEVENLSDRISFHLEVGWYPKKFGEGNPIEFLLRKGSEHEYRNLFGEEITVEKCDFEWKFMVVNQNGLMCTFLPSSSAIPPSSVQVVADNQL